MTMGMDELQVTQTIATAAEDTGLSVIAVRLTRPFDRALLEAKLASAGAELVAHAHPLWPAH